MNGPIGYELSSVARRASEITKDLNRASAGVLRTEAAQLLELIELMDVEIASRGKYISDMNAIVGYDNSDGRHSTPCPQDLAKRAVEDAWKYRQLTK